MNNLTVRSEDVLAALLPKQVSDIQPSHHPMAAGGPIQDRFGPHESPEEVIRDAEPEAAREGMPEAQGEGHGTPPGTLEGISTGDEEAAIDESEKGTREARMRKRKAPKQ